MIAHPFLYTIHTSHMLIALSLYDLLLIMLSYHWILHTSAIFYVILIINHQIVYSPLIVNELKDRNDVTEDDCFCTLS